VGTERGERVIVLAKAFCTIEVYEGWIQKCHIMQNLNSQAWTELRLFQDSNSYHLAKRLCEVFNWVDSVTILYCWSWHWP